MSGGIVGVGAPDPGTNALINRLANPPNPLEQAGQTINALTGIRNYQAQQASADAYRQSVNPLTGEVDLGKYKALLSQGPGAFNFGPLVTSGGQAVGAVGQGTQADVNAKLDQLNATGTLMYPLLKQAASGPVDPKEVQATLDQAHEMGLVTNQQYQQWSGALSGMSPEDARGWVLGANMGNGEALRLLGGNVAMPDVGPGFKPTQVSPLGATPAVTYVPKAPGVEPVTLTVGTQTIPNVPYNVATAITQNPELLKTYYPQQYQQMHPGDQVTMAPGGGGGAPGAPNVPPGHYPAPLPSSAPSPSGSGGGGPAPAPAPPPATGGGGGAEKPQATGPLYLQPPPPQPAEAGGVGLTPQTGYNENVIQPSQKASTALATGAGQTSDIDALIDDMRSQVNQPGWNTGLGAQAGSTWRQMLQRLGVNANPGAAPAQIDSAEAASNEFAKDANLIASRQLAAIGNPSDARQGLAEAITPGMAQSKEGVLGISATLKGNQDALNRTNTAWLQAKQNGWSDGQHLQWLNQNWKATDPATGGRFDPRVFWLADTAGNADDQWRRFGQKIPTDQQAQFLKNVQYAQKQGWVTQNPDQSFAVVSP